jgi:hypothetical protein
MIGALARAGLALGEPRYVEAAARAAEFAEGTLWDAPSRALRRRWRAGEAAIDGYLEDYAFLAAGLIDLYQATFDLRWIRFAEALVARMVELFGDAEHGGFWSTSGKDPSVLLWLKEDYDGAEPAGNSIAALALLRLAELTGRAEWRALAESTIRCFSGRLREGPHAMPKMLTAFAQLADAPPQLVLAGEKGDPHTRALVAAVADKFVPDLMLVLADADLRREYGEKLPWIAEMGPLDGRTAAYLCRDHACQRPTADPATLAAALPVKTMH